MATRMVISCDGEWNGMPCRGAFPSRWLSADEAREEAAEAGWCWDEDAGDRCPAHTRLHADR